MDDGDKTPNSSLIARIDRAFDNARTVKSVQRDSVDAVIAPPTVRRKRGDPALSNAGGFLPPSPPTSGGFLLDDDDAVSVSNTGPSMMQSMDRDEIPLALIPSALQILDLPPADGEIMEIFRNAAGSAGGQAVTREDFRAVCQVLLSNQEEEEEDPSHNSSETSKSRLIKPASSELDDKDVNERPYSDSDDESEEDNYVDESSDDDEEYAPSKGKQIMAAKGKAPVRLTKTTSTRKRKREASPHGDEMPTLTRRQRVACREAFGLFFPDVEERDLDSQRITIKDISRVAKILKIKLTAEEVLDMLQEFSTSPDKSISLSDFENIMMVARLA